MTIEIYTTPACGYCRLAKAHLKRLGLHFQELDIVRQPEKAAEMTARSGRRTVPQIFVDDRPIGGYLELHLLERAGRYFAGNELASSGQPELVGTNLFDANGAIDNGQELFGGDPPNDLRRRRSITSTVFLRNDPQ